MSVIVSLALAHTPSLSLLLLSSQGKASIMNSFQSGNMLSTSDSYSED